MLRNKTAFALVTMAFAVMLVALPASAAQPETVHTDVQMVFDISTGTMHGEGTWSSQGLITSSGNAEEDHFVAGWPPGYVFKTAHLTETWADASGTITLQTQLNVGEWTIVDFPFDIGYVGLGHWVIKSGTGAYENLWGEGEVTFAGSITPESFPNLVVTETYEGVAHVAP